MTGDKEDAAILNAVVADAMLPFVPMTVDMLVELLHTLIEKVDYNTLILEQLVDLLAPPSFEWSLEDDGETMSA